MKILHAKMAQNVSVMWTMSSSIAAVLRDMKEKLVKAEVTYGGREGNKEFHTFSPSTLEASQNV